MRVPASPIIEGKVEHGDEDEQHQEAEFEVHVWSSLSQEDVDSVGLGSDFTHRPTSLSELSSDHLPM